MNILLLIHNIGFIFSAIATIGSSLFTFFNKRDSTKNVTMALVFFTVAIFIISHVAGVNTKDPEVSKNILMFNCIIFFIGAFNMHAVFAFTREKVDYVFIQSLLYLTAIALTVFFFLNPELLLLPSVPKMYFPNYYNPGVLNWIRVAFLYGIFIPYAWYELIRAYIRTTDPAKKIQIKYYTLAISFGYIFGYIPNFLVYDIPIDPLWGMLFMVFCAIPFVFAAIKYELFDVKVVAKGAFMYGIAVAGIGGIVALFNLSNQIIIELYPEFPFWITPLVTAVLILVVSYFVWNKLREGDLMKYEFITTATHKFRTPLTHIKWATDNLSQKNLDNDTRLQVEYIQSANTRLVELTDSLVNVSEDEPISFSYDTGAINFKDIMEDATSPLLEQIRAKGLLYRQDISPDLQVLADRTRIKSVLQILIENSIHYTPKGGEISVSATQDDANKEVTCIVQDTGIGIPKEEASYLFSKFYRGDKARLADTEGMGIGLFIARQIIEKHHGKIHAESEGEGKGSKFIFTLPLSK
ncbi:MAG: HAMP domain-containing sensor histidine kinase [Candidatus Paceibacterota bacterium]